MSNFEPLPGEKIIRKAGGDCWSTPQLITEQVPGQFIFTNKRIIFCGNGVIEKLRLKFEIFYTDIDDIEPYLVLFFRTGIRIYLKDGNRYRISLRKREEFMDIIKSHI